jgi:hypothetical protein
MLYSDSLPPTCHPDPRRGLSSLRSFKRLNIHQDYEGDRSLPGRHRDDNTKYKYMQMTMMQRLCFIATLSPSTCHPDPRRGLSSLRSFKRLNIHQDYGGDRSLPGRHRDDNTKYKYMQMTMMQRLCFIATLSPRPVTPTQGGVYLRCDHSRG